MTMLKLFAVPLFAVMLAGAGGGIAEAADAMSSDGGAMATDAKADCMKKAAMETDQMKMKQMQDECAKMDTCAMSGGGMSSDAMSSGGMSSDAMKPKK